MEFWIGQKDTWDTHRDTAAFREVSVSKLKILQNIKNVFFFNHIDDQKEYWSYLNQVDIGFSTAFQEGFGLSMMEQEAAGIACVVPNAEVYPELHAGCLIVDRSKLSEGLEELIENPIKRKIVSQRCIDNVSKYDTSNWVRSLTEQLK